MKFVWADVAEDFTVTTLPVGEEDAVTRTRRIAAVGRLTRLGGELLETAVTEQFLGAPATRPRRVRVDRAAVTGADAAGIAGLDRARAIAWRHGAHLVIAERNSGAAEAPTRWRATRMGPRSRVGWRRPQVR